MDCETVRKWLVKNSAESENMNWILANTKPCPECKRPIVKQFHAADIKFPLPHRVLKTPKEFKTTFKASRPNTYY